MAVLAGTVLQPASGLSARQLVFVNTAELAAASDTEAAQRPAAPGLQLAAAQPD